MFLFRVAATLAFVAVVWGLVRTDGWASKDSGKELVLYCAQDQPFAETLIEEFTRRTGVKVRTAYDSEAIKTVGLANRLLAEKEHPRADVFWGNEEFRTRQLAAAGVWSAPGNGDSGRSWWAFGRRTRRLVVARSLPVGQRPDSLSALTNARWAGRVSLAVPLFGTTSTHFHALRAHWGAERWDTWCRALADNRPFLEEGNSGVVRRVARGEALVGLTDSDDIRIAQREGLPVEPLEVSEDMMTIPNTVALVIPAAVGSPAREFVAFLLDPAQCQRLVAAGALDPEGTRGDFGFEPAWDRILADLSVTQRSLEKRFRR